MVTAAAALFLFVSSRAEKNKQAANSVKRRRPRLFLVIMLISMTSSMAVQILSRHGIGAIVYLAFIFTFMAAVFIASLVAAHIPLGPNKIGTVYDVFPKDSVSVAVSLSKYILSHRSLRIFADGMKVAAIYSGEELRIPMPEGRHEIAFSSFIERLKVSATVVDVHEGSAFHIWRDAKNDPLQPLQITPVSGDRSALEERSRLDLRRNMRMTGVTAAIFSILSILLWAMVAMRLDFAIL